MYTYMYMYNKLVPGGAFSSETFEVKEQLKDIHYQQYKVHVACVCTCT